VTENRLLNSLADDDQSARPMSEHSSDEVMDLQGLYERCMGNLDLMERVLDKFERRLPEELAELERALERGDATMVAQLAHRIKGSTSNVSAAGLQQAAKEIEDLGRSGRVADKACLTNLHEQWRRYVDWRAAARSSADGGAKHRACDGLCVETGEKS